MCGVRACNVGKLKRCTQCKAVYYCSRDCQTKHWGEHKLACKQLVAAAAASEEDLTTLD